MKHIVIVNMGAPSSAAEMRTFLRNMFRDKHILPMPLVGRMFLSELISRLRYTRSWTKYESIGGSPLVKSCTSIAGYMQQLATEEIAVAYSYTAPRIGEVIDRLAKDGALHMCVVTMYPHACFSTTKSVEADLQHCLKKHPGLKIQIVPEYHSHPGFVTFWAQRIEHTRVIENMKKPTLVFSAHSVPRYQITRGDTYEQAIHESARLIAQDVNMPYLVGFQSRVGSMEWVGPETRTVIQSLISNGINEILVVPISFLTENLETRYDIDTELIPSIVAQNPGTRITKVSLDGTEQEVARLLTLLASSLTSHEKQTSPLQPTKSCRC